MAKSHTARIAAERGAQSTLPEVPSAGLAAEEGAPSRGAPPAARVSFGGVHASVWRNTGEKGDFFTVTLERRYQDGAGEWKSSNSYGPTDLLALQKVSDLAVDKVIELQQGRGRSA